MNLRNRYDNDLGKREEKKYSQENILIKKSEKNTMMCEIKCK